MVKRMAWIVLGWLWYCLSPACPVAQTATAESPDLKLGQSSALYNVTANPYCVSQPGEYITFTYLMNNSSGETKYFVLTQDQNAAELHTLFPGEIRPRLFSISAGTATYRLHPRGWCKIFNRDELTPASNLQQMAQLEVSKIQTQLISHQQTRATIQTLEESLLAAVAAEDTAAITSLKKQITTLEKKDDKTLTKIKTSQDAISSDYGHSADADAVVVELDLRAFTRNRAINVDANTDPTKFTIVPDGGEENPGFRLLVNDSDDNNNKKDDREDAKVPGENDTGEFWWLYARPIDVTTAMTVASSAPNLRFWKQAIKKTADTLPKTITEPYLRGGTFMEGFRASNIYLGELLTATFLGCQDRLNGTVDGITEVKFESADGATAMFGGGANVQENGNPNAGGGDRVFPDKNTPGGALNDKLKVRARIQPPRAGVTLFFRPFDVDDPSSRNAALDNDATQGDNYKDNRGAVTVGGVDYKEGSIAGADLAGIAKATTDGAGWAQVEFQMTRQPGDNFRLVAGLTRLMVVNLQVNGGHDAEASVSTLRRVHLFTSGNPNIGAVGRLQSHLLTVWRQGHLERDSMAPVAGNILNGTIFAVDAEAAPPYLTVTIDQTMAQANMYETDGRVAPFSHLSTGGRDYDIVSNTAGTRLVVQPGAVPITPGNAFTLYDDDDGAVLPGLPDMGLMQEKFGTAYILIQNDEGGTAGSNTLNVLSVVNLAALDDASVRARVLLGLDTDGNRERDFWVLYAQSAFQADITADVDPNTETPGGFGGVCTVDAGTGGGALIFKEGLRDYTRNVEGLAPAALVIREQMVVVHEVAHEFGLVNGGGIMGVGVYVVVAPLPGFDPSDLNIIRNRVNSPGKP